MQEQILNEFEWLFSRLLGKKFETHKLTLSNCSYYMILYYTVEYGQN